MPTPDVFEFADYRKYLAAWFDAKKEENPRLSHRWFAKELGTANPSVLANIISGRRQLPADRIDAFCTVLELDRMEAAYFRALVDFGHAGDRGEADRAWATLADLRAQAQPPGVGVDSFGFLASWYIPAVHELARLPGFVEDPVWIASRMDPPITPEEARQALDTCENLGFLRREEGRLVGAHPNVRTSETVQALSSWPYHRDGVELAARGLQRSLAGGVPGLRQETVFLGATLAVPASKIPEIRRSMYEMLARVNAATEPWTAESDRVVHLTLALVPVARLDPPEG